MKTTVKTQPRIGHVGRRRKKKVPSPETLLRVEWLTWLIAEFGPDTVADWQEPPVPFAEWKRARELAAHEAA